MIGFPNAKINLGLFIKGKRSDGFHDIETVMLPLNFYDILEIVPSETNETRMKITGIPIPGDPNENLVAKAWDLLKEHAGIPFVNIHLHKIIPFQAGLGGGSSDAAFALKMLNQLFALKSDNNLLKSFALQLGSDCPYFLENTAQLTSGRGEKLKPVKLDLHDKHFVVIKPPASIGTAEAYANINIHERNVSLEDMILMPVNEWKNHIENDFEEYVYQKHPEILEIKEKLYALGSEFALMSGSGSAVFGIFNEAPQIAKYFPGNVYWEGKVI